jgi:hypothetical protein
VDDIVQGCVSLDETDERLDMIADIVNVREAIHLLYAAKVFPTPEECIRNSFSSPLNSYVNMFN